MNGYTRQKNGGSEQGNTWKGGWNWRSVCGLDSYYNQRILVFNSIYSNTCFSFPFYLLAQTNEGKDAHPLLGECWQSPPVPERAKSAPRKHGISRYRGWESQAHTWPYLDYYPEIPGKDVEIHTFSFPYLEPLWCCCPVGAASGSPLWGESGGFIFKWLMKMKLHSQSCTLLQTWGKWVTGGLCPDGFRVPTGIVLVSHLKAEISSLPASCTLVFALR